MIDEIVTNAVKKVSDGILKGDLDLRSIIYMAVQAGMADAYQRGIDMGQKKD